MSKFLIVIPFNLPWDWSADYERQTVLTLSRKGHKVIVYLQNEAKFVLNTNRTTYPKISNVTFVSPRYYIPFKRFMPVEKLNRLISLWFLEHKHNINSQSLLWIFNPDFVYFLDYFKKSISIYDCVDYMGSENASLDKKINSEENRLIKYSDYFFVNSKALQNLHKRVRNGYLVPQGFDSTVFKSPIKTNVNFPHDMPIIGFVGSVDSRLDYKLIFSLVEKCKKYRFIFWGPINFNYFDSKYKTQQNINKLLSYKNVIYGKSPRRELSGIISQFDVCTIPYDIGQNRNKYCYPMKLFEYFYLGKPIVSTAILELKRFPNLVKIGKNYVEWQSILEYFLSNKWSAEKAGEQMRFAIKNSWEEKVRQIVYTIK